MEKEWIKRYSLKLDAAWQPLEIITAYKAFNMCYSGRAKIVSSYPQSNLLIPSVIVLHHYIRRFPFRLSCNRKNVFWRDNYQCQYCCRTFKFNELTMDHVVPKSRGGEKSWENIVTSWAIRGKLGKSSTFTRNPRIPRNSKKVQGNP